MQSGPGDNKEPKNLLALNTAQSSADLIQGIINHILNINPSDPEEGRELLRQQLLTPIDGFAPLHVALMENNPPGFVPLHAEQNIRGQQQNNIQNNADNDDDDLYGAPPPKGKL